MERKRDTNTTQLGTKYCRMERKGFYVFLLDIVLLYILQFLSKQKGKPNIVLLFSMLVVCLSLLAVSLSMLVICLSLYFPHVLACATFSLVGLVTSKKRKKKKKKSKSCISNGFRRSNQRARSICSWFRFFSLLCFRFLLSAFSR